MTALVLLAPTTAARADVRLPKIFGSHMILQRDKPIRVFGWATEGEKITVEINGKTAMTTGGADGRFRVDLPAMKADGKAHSLTIEGNNKIVLTDVLLGEVWICSGQSNMEWRLSSSLNSNEEIAAANFPNIRLFDVPGHIKAPTPNEDTPGTWKICTPDTAASFSAVGYFYGRKLNQETGVPIGLIGTNWGGTRIEPWTPPIGFEQVPELKDYVDNLNGLDPTTAQGKVNHEKYLTQVASWSKEARKALEAGLTFGDPPRMNLKPKGGATTIYNGMVHGLAPFSVRGAIWYQGESNAGDGLRYYHMKRALVAGWRTVFENPELSFYWVQLANFQQPTDNPGGGGWGPVREGQRMALDIPHTGMAVIIDIGEARDIHPKNKQDVGTRLARWALRDHYGKQIVPSGPLYKSQMIAGGKITISFDHIGGGLMIGKKAGLLPTSEVSNGTLNRFAIAGEDRKWHWAEAKIVGNTVVVSAADVKAPVAVRYGYESNPVGSNLYNKEGLPASPFRTDNW